MLTFLFILLAIGFVWLVVKVNQTRDEVGTLSALLHQLDRDLLEIKQRISEKRPESRVPETEQATDKLTDLPPRPAQAPDRGKPIVATAAAPPPLPTELVQSPPILAHPTFGPAQGYPTASSEFQPAPPVLPSVSPPAEPLVNWERFMGAKLFAWLGGFALFLGVAFFVKYSFEHNLIPAEARVALGFITGIALLTGGIVLKRREYAVTAQTLSATGILILYAVSFACHSYYHFTGPKLTFALMVAITGTAFWLAVRMEARVVAVLGLLGGFVTPILLSTGQDQALALFTYIALLDVGLLAVALHRRWHFLVLLGAIGTLAMQVGWTVQFFEPEKILVALAVFLSFDLLFLSGFIVSEKLGQENDPSPIAAVGLSFLTLAFVSFLLTFPTVSARPGVFSTFILGADLCLLAIALMRPSLHAVPVLGGGAAFLLLSIWTARHLTPELLNWALGMYFVFALLHSASPMILERLRPGGSPIWWSHLFPPVALLLVLFPLWRNSEASWFVWVFVLLIDSLAIGLAVLTASVLSILSVLALTALVTAIWILKLPAELTSLPSLLFVIGGFALFFFVLSIVAEHLVARHLAKNTESKEARSSSLARPAPALLLQVPALSAILPFLLLIMVTARLPLLNPSPIFGVAFVLAGLLLGVALAAQMDGVVAVALGCVLALEMSWHAQHFRALEPWTPLVWYVTFYSLFTAFPFVFQRRIEGRPLPWAMAALAGPLHFFLIHRVVAASAGTAYIGLLPAALAIPMLAGLVYLVRRIAADHPKRNALLAWFGGSALFFITLIFPVQFRREWLTVAWALEGAALLWLFHRIPHGGLRATGVALLCVVFVRLALNPAVLTYHPRTGTPLFNWHLYSYGIATASLLAGARLLAAPRNRLWNLNVCGLLYGLGTILGFLLVNIEIADYFSTGPTLTFEFSGNFARDMTYSIAWGCFALLLLLIGFRQRVAGARYASLGLLSVTLVKLFLHDLSQLAQLYRIGAFIAVATILILASFLYQRFFSKETAETTTKPKEGQG